MSAATITIYVHCPECDVRINLRHLKDPDGGHSGLELLTHYKIMHADKVKGESIIPYAKRHYETAV